MANGRRLWKSPTAVLGVTAIAVAVTAVVCGCDNAERNALSPTGRTPNYAVGGVTGVTCDVDIALNVGIDSSGLRPSNAASYNLHISGSAGSGSPSVTATVDQLPGVTLDLMTAPLGGPIPFQSSGPGSPPAPDVSTWTPPTQATIDSLAQNPIDAFCYVVRDAGGIPLAPPAVGGQGSAVQTTNYPNTVAATVTSDASSGLVTQEVVTIGGTVVRDTRFEYASASGVVYRSAMTMNGAYTIEGQPVGLSVAVSTRNVVRTTGGQ